jgi:putative ATP-grasp target RiPP
MDSRMMTDSRSGSDMAGIFPALFVEPVASRWIIPANHYDTSRQVTIETETGMPAFPLQMSSTGTASGSATKTDSYTKCGNTLCVNDHSSDTDSD